LVCRNNRHQDFDPEHASILCDNNKWCDTLSGEDPKGLRDVLLHDGGAMEFAREKQNPEARRGKFAKVSTEAMPSDERGRQDKSF
jgi:hypothetical protein